jgi:molybdate transport system ATP-binding protein
VAEIMSRLDVRPLAGMTDAGAVLTATVAAQDEAAGLTALDHPAGRMVIPHLEAALGSALRIRIRARDVAIAVGDPGRISIRNRLAARVVEIASAAPPIVDVKLAVGEDHIIARVTSDAVASLGLARGMDVTALVKAASFDRRAAE